MKLFATIFILISALAFNGIFAEGRSTSPVIGQNIVRLIAKAESKHIRREARYLQVTPSPVPILPDCYVCGASNMKPTNFSGELTVNGVGLNCAAMDLAGKLGQISQSDCPTYQEAAKETCVCAIETASVLDDDSIDDILTGSEPCYICGSADSFPAKGDNLVMVPESEGISCSMFDYLARNTLISGAICEGLIYMASPYCGGCSNTAAPTQPLQMEPTISPMPTPEDGPLEETKCYICGSADMEVDKTKDDELLLVAQTEATCKEFERQALKGVLDKETCTLLQNRVEEMSNPFVDSKYKCTCVPSNGSTPNGPPTKSLAVAPQRSPTAPSPSSSAASVMMSNWFTLVGESFLIIMYFRI